MQLWEKNPQEWRKSEITLRIISFILNEGINEDFTKVKMSAYKGKDGFITISDIFVDTNNECVVINSKRILSLIISKLRYLMEEYIDSKISIEIYSFTDYRFLINEETDI